MTIQLVPGSEPDNSHHIIYFHSYVVLPEKLVSNGENEKMSNDMPPKKIVIFILYAIALAMGVATIVLPLLGQAVDLSMVGIALFCLGVAGLNQASGES